MGWKVTEIGRQIFLNNALPQNITGIRPLPVGACSSLMEELTCYTLKIDVIIFV